MNSLKNVLVVTILLGVGYAAYTAINKPGPSPSPEQADGWPTSVNVEMPNGSDSKSAAPKNPFTARGDRSTERVPARDADPFGSPRVASDRSGPIRSSLASPGSAERFPRTTNPSGEAPGQAASSDIAPNALSTSPLAAPPGKKSDGLSAAGRRPEFVAMMQDAEKRLAKGELAEVQLALSRLYGEPELTAEEARQLIELLDQLAGSVIYSRRHLLEPPYVVKQGDSLQSIAQSYNVPWQLLAKVNGVRDPERLAPGTQLKVLRGPFEAVVSLERFELALMLGGRYAGRFPIGIGRDNPQLEGAYSVRKKLVQPAYRGPDREFAAGDPNNPLGKLAIELADRLAIHGTNDIKNLRRAESPGTICLGPRDIEDLYDILTAGSEAAVASRVTIRR